MKKFISALLVVLTIVLFGIIATATPANASSTSASVEVVKSAPVLVAEKVAIAPPNVIGGGVIAPKWLYVSCYTAMNGDLWCWRYACTWFETVALGCRDGWYRVSTTWRA